MSMNLFFRPKFIKHRNSEHRNNLNILDNVQRRTGPEGPERK